MINFNGFEQKNVIRGRINDTKTFIKNEMAAYAQCVKSLKDAARKKTDAERKFSKKANEKNEAALAEATQVYDAEYTDAAKILGNLINFINNLDNDWKKLIYQFETTDADAAPKEKSDYEKYRKTVTADKAKSDDVLTEAGITLEPIGVADDDSAPVAATPEDAPADEPVVDEPAADEPVADEPVADEPVEDEPVEDEPVVDEPKTVIREARPARNIAPVSIDISSHVEKVVSLAMDKVAGALEKRIDDYFANYVPNVPDGLGSTAIVGGGLTTETAALQDKIAEDEKALLEKLVSIVEVLKKLNTDMATITSTYATLDARTKEIIETQKVTNDMQRHTLREQQGVQINQRVVNTDQLKITEDQVAIIDLGKKAADEQKRISSAQEALADTQKAIVETQASIEEAMKAVIAEQKKIIAGQQAIVTENAKQVEAHKNITAAQTAVADSQKEVLTTQKQLAKDQRGTADRQKECADLQRELAEDVKEILKAQKATKVKKPQAKTE